MGAARGFDASTIPAPAYTARLIRLLVLAGAAACRCLSPPISSRPAPLIINSVVWKLRSEGATGDLTSKLFCTGAGLERLRGGGRNKKGKAMGGPQGGRGGLRRGRGGLSNGRGGQGPSGGRGSDAKKDTGPHGDAGVSKADRGRGGDQAGAARGGRGGEGRGGGGAGEGLEDRLRKVNVNVLDQKRPGHIPAAFLKLLQVLSLPGSIWSPQDEETGS